MDTSDAATLLLQNVNRLTVFLDCTGDLNLLPSLSYYYKIKTSHK